MRCSRLFSFTFIMVSEPDILEDESFKWLFSARLASKNCGPNSVFSKDLLFIVIGLCPRMSWRRIAPAAAGRRCCFSRTPGLPASWRRRFSEARWKVWPSFQTLFESCEPDPWYSTVGLEDPKHTSIEVLFLFAQRWDRNSQSTTYQNSCGTLRNTQWWVLVLADDFQLVSIANHFVDECTNSVAKNFVNECTNMQWINSSST